jgi:hypothetical protein
MCSGCAHIGQRRAAAGISEAHSGQVFVVGDSSWPPLATRLERVRRSNDEQVDRERHDEERDERVQEGAVAHFGFADRERRGAEVGQAEQPQERREDVAHERGDDGAEGHGNDDRHRQVDDVAAQDELPESAEHGARSLHR